MSIGSDFRKTAQEVVYLFAEENGKSDYHHLVSDTYNTSTGTSLIIYDTRQYYICFDAIELGIHTSTSAYTADYLRDNRVAIIAGDDLELAIKVGDLVEIDSRRHKVVFWDTDMYKASYEIHIRKKPENV